MKMMSIGHYILGGLAVWLPFCCEASPVTFELWADKEECFYVIIPESTCTISYYFAVQHDDKNSFEVNYKVLGPNDRKTALVERTRIKQGEWEYKAKDSGEYAFCFTGSSKSNKIIDIEIDYSCETHVGSIPDKNSRPLRKGSEDTDTLFLHEKLKDSLDKIERQLSTLQQNMKYYKVRNSRSHHTVESTAKSADIFSLYCIGITLLMGVSQLFIVRLLFKNTRILPA
ncbi:Erp3p Ecym_5257 [Eremothecium cymbalariae DBVPG|uniref:GOLD domain-containing protein n=1 Tax=Eremothecium cymbalariae (strain CBS 270.75 / DBVPG 7215 / KCTC 17166 / NRRL Y-17582) TaxID=931890 RepID=I6ND81_ERECY|nr:hypothetical protein Ecym_5257 [Eremothecium cymbalariae DBVPG\